MMSLSCGLRHAKSLLEAGEERYTCVAFDGRDIYTSTKRGVAPLLDWLDSGTDLSEFSVADRVVGKGAAFLYIRLGIRELYAEVISRPAKALLEEHKIEVSFGVCVSAIRNRENSGPCPIETAVLPIEDTEEALACIRKKLRELRS